MHCVSTVSRYDVEEEAADQQEQRQSQEHIGSVSPRLLPPAPGMECTLKKCAAVRMFFRVEGLFELTLSE